METQIKGNISKVIRQYGEHGNDYSVLEIGDTLNDVIDLLMKKGIVEAVKEAPKKVESVKSAPKVLKTDDKGGYVARSPATADMVYYILGEERFWVKNPETLKKLGFGFSDVRGITNEEMHKLKTGKPINLKEPTPLEVEKAKDGFDKYNI